MITTTTSAAVKASYDIVPLPASVSMQKGEPFMLSSATRIVYTGSDEAMKRNASLPAVRRRACSTAFRRCANLCPSAKRTT